MVTETKIYCDACHSEMKVLLRDEERLYVYFKIKGFCCMREDASNTSKTLLEKLKSFFGFEPPIHTEISSSIFPTVYTDLYDYGYHLCKKCTDEAKNLMKGFFDEKRRVSKANQEKTEVWE